MNRPCPIAIHCGDYPFQNLSSEGPEPDWVPPIGEYWTALGYCCEGTPKLEYSIISQTDADLALARTLETACPTCPETLVFCADASCPDGSNLATICVPTSQEDADALAAAAAAAMLPFCGDTTPLYSATCACPDGVTDVHTVKSSISQAVAEAQCEAIPKDCNGTPPGGGGDVCNEPQTCCVVCPDGTSFCYTVPACAIYSDTVANANAQAYTLACIQAEAQKICLGPIDRCCCSGSAYSSDIVMTTGARAATWTVAAGALPTGLALSGASSSDGRITITGTPTTAGNYTFSIRATDANGNYAQQTYEIDVISITTSALDDWQTGVAYSQQLTASGGSGNYQWSIQSGALPDGLTMDDDGLISGTPTGADSGTMPILFAVVDLTCEAALKSKFLPRATLTTVSTTTTKTKRGWYAYGTNSGTLYKRIDVTGEHTQTAETSPLIVPTSIGLEFCGGAKQVYSGYTQIDLYGNVINLHNKDLTVACANTPPNLEHPTIIDIDTLIWTALDNAWTLLGYCWTDDPASCNTCDDDETTWSAAGNYAQARSFDIPYDFYLDESLYSTTPTVLSYSGTAKDQYCRIVRENEAYPTGFPTGSTDIYHFIEPWVRITSVGDWSLTLSDEYTDAEAESTKTVITGAGAIADGGTTAHAVVGYINHDATRTTAVNFTIDCSNLVPGHTYQVAYQLWNLTTNAKITVTQNFVALLDTYQITGSVPTPSAGSQIKISKATITML